MSLRSVRHVCGFVVVVVGCGCGCGCGLSECGDSGALVFRGGVVSRKRKSGVTLVWVAVAAKHKQTAKMPNAMRLFNTPEPL